MEQIFGMSPPSNSPPDITDNNSSDDDSISEDDDVSSHTESDDEYDPQGESTDDDEEDDSESDDDQEDDDMKEELELASAVMPLVNMIQPGVMAQPQPIMFMIPHLAFPQPPPPPPRNYECCDNNEKDTVSPPSKKRVRTEENDFVKYFTPDEKNYWKQLEETKKTELLDLNKVMKEKHNAGNIPMRFKFLKADIDPSSKALLLAKLDQFQMMHEGSGEYFKLRNWLQATSRIPFGNYFPLPVTPEDSTSKIADFLQDVHKTLDSKVYGHVETKNQILRILAQWISNPGSKGHCIGIQGSPGCGKTSMIKDGVCKALGLPFGFIALGGASDGSFLEGHSFTYEGSTYGKIAEILMKTQCMNPILFFDELDKVSGTRRGDEIIGILTHLTDSSQNERFQDRYFGELDLNLSKSLIVFSYNDESLINPILKDRMITIKVKGYNTKDKLRIAKDYLIPELLSQYKMTSDDVLFSNDIVEYIISKVNEEEGVRNLKRGIEAVISWINMHRYIPPEDGVPITFPVEVTEEHIKKYLRPEDGSNRISNDVMRMMYI